LPQMRQAVKPRAPSSRAPPMPPTTPPMIFLDELLRPELPPLLPFAARAVVRALVVTGISVLVVLVPMTVLPPCVLVYV